MAVLGTIGGARDIMATRQACMNAATGYDDADQRYRALVDAYEGYTQADFEAMGYDVDDAFFLADQLPKIKAILDGADWEALGVFADKTRDITRI
jgi:hypothetical protein